MNVEMRERFYERLNEVVNRKDDNNFYITDEKYRELLNDVKQAKAVERKKSVHYRRLKRYDIMTVGNEEKLIVPISSEKDDVVHYVRYEELFSIIHDTHINTGHGGRTRTLKEASRKYKNITTESVVIYLRLCEPCQKKQKVMTKGLVVKPIVHSEMNSRAQIDLIDMQSNPDENFKFIFVYQDHLTKFVNIRALRTKRAEEVAYHLLDIFTTFGAPCILHSDNGREFCNKVIQSLCDMWADIKIVHGKPRHSQSQGSVERANQDIENMLATWMETNQTSKWSEGIRFIQAMKNRAYHEGIKCSPYEAMFGVPMKMGLATSKLPHDVIMKLASEEQLEEILVGTDVSVPSTSKAGEGQTSTTSEELAPQIADTEPHDDDEFDEHSSFDLASATQRKMCTLREIRESAREGLESQAKKMKNTSKEKFPEPEVGQNVRIKIPDVDRSKIDPKGMIAVILKKDDEFYQLGTSSGKLNTLYSRNQFTICTENFIYPEDVPDEEVSLRTTVRQQSLVGGQGFKKCHCFKKCSTKKCRCKAANMKCNSKCHNSLPCCNK